MRKIDNEKYVQRGRDLVIAKHNPEWEEDTKCMNLDKVGPPFQYADVFIMSVAGIRIAQGIEYRQLEGMVSEMTDGNYAPDYTTLYRRIAKLDIDINNDMVTIRNKTNAVTMIMDATGLKQHNRGEWMRQKWQIRRGFVKMHVMVDADTQKILALSITDESVGDSRELKPLLGESLKKIQDSSKEMPSEYRPTYNAGHLALGISPLALDASKEEEEQGEQKEEEPSCILLGDAAYSSRANLEYCAGHNITPLILHKINSTTKNKGAKNIWSESIRDQFGGSPKVAKVNTLSTEEKRENQRYWKSKVRYNKRWIVEYVFSAFKRMFGDHLLSLKWENIIQEMKLKVGTYNKWRDQTMAREAQMAM